MDAVEIFGVEIESRILQRLALGAVGALALFLGSVVLLYSSSLVGGAIVLGIGLFALILGWSTTQPEHES